MVGRPFQRAGRGQEVYPNNREALPEVREWSGGPREGPGVFSRLFWRDGCGCEAHLDGSQALLVGREALSKGLEWSGGLPG